MFPILIVAPPPIASRVKYPWVCHCSAASCSYMIIGGIARGMGRQSGQLPWKIKKYVSIYIFLEIYRTPLFGAVSYLNPQSARPLTWKVVGDHANISFWRPGPQPLAS